MVPPSDLHTDDGSEGTMGFPVPDAGAAREEPPRLGPKKAIIIFVAFFAAQLLVGLVIGMVVGIWLVVARGTSPAAMAEAQRLVVMPAALGGMLVGGLVAFWLTRRSLPGTLRTGALRSIGWSAASSKDLLVATLVGVALSLFYLFGLAAYWPMPPAYRWGPVVRAAASGGTPRHLWTILALGAAALLARVRANSLAPAVALHAAYNLGLAASVYAGAA